jgi:hypothetical protein
LVRKNDNELKYSSSEFIGGIKKIQSFHTKFFEEVGKKYGLVRGIQGSRASHTNLKQYGALEEKKLSELEMEKSKAKARLEEAELSKQQAERFKNETAVQLKQMQAMNDQLNKRDIALAKKEKENADFEKDAIQQTPKLAPPPANPTQADLESWHTNAQNMVDKAFKGLAYAYRIVKQNYGALLRKFAELTNGFESMKKRAEKAENDLATKPLDEIAAERDMMVKNQNRDKSQKGGFSR